MPHQVLIYGHDLVLLRTRELILRSAGFEVCVTGAADEVDAVLSGGKADLLILCHTIDRLERSRILAEVPSSRKSMAILFLAADSQSPAVAENDLVFNTLDGPYNFLRAVCQLTHEPLPAPFLPNRSNPGHELCHDSQAQ